MGKADYGIDAPTVVRNLAVAGALCLVLTFVPGFGGFVFAAISLLGTAGLMFFGSKVVKLRIRDKILDGLHLKGDEQVLDVGCGSGLMLIGAAKRLTSGKAVGIDLWQKVDQSGNDPAKTNANADAEGVRDRIQLETADARELPFSEGSFETIVSSWALHNIPTPEGKDAAIREIARVLKPGGQVAIVDIGNPERYADVLKEAGLTDVKLSGPSFVFVIPSRTVTARKSS